MIVVVALSAKSPPNVRAGNLCNECVENPAGRADDQLAAGFRSDAFDTVGCALWGKHHVARTKYEHRVPKLAFIVPFAEDVVSS